MASEVSFRALVTNPASKSCYSGSASSTTLSEASYDSDTGSESSATTTAASVCSGGMGKEHGNCKKHKQKQKHKHGHEHKHKHKHVKPTTRGQANSVYGTFGNPVANYSKSIPKLCRNSASKSAFKAAPKTSFACRICNAYFDSRNRLFTHLRQRQHVAPSSTTTTPSATTSDAARTSKPLLARRRELDRA